MDSILFIFGVKVSLTFFFLFVYIFCEFDPAFFSNSIFHRHSDVDDTDAVKKKKQNALFALCLYHSVKRLNYGVFEKSIHVYFILT